MVQQGEFLEHAMVFGNHYGTPKQPVFEALAAGRDVLFDIDWQGTQQLRQQARDDVVSIFVLPPSARRVGTPPEARAPKTPPTSSPSAWPRPTAKSAIGPNTITSSSTTMFRARRRKWT
jgi:hypothetical protein